MTRKANFVLLDGWNHHIIVRLHANELLHLFIWWFGSTRVIRSRDWRLGRCAVWLNHRDSPVVWHLARLALSEVVVEVRASGRRAKTIWSRCWLLLRWNLISISVKACTCDLQWRDVCLTSLLQANPLDVFTNWGCIVKVRLHWGQCNCLGRQRAGQCPSLLRAHRHASYCVHNMLLLSTWRSEHVAQFLANGAIFASTVVWYHCVSYCAVSCRTGYSSSHDVSGVGFLVLQLVLEASRQEHLRGSLRRVKIQRAKHLAAARWLWVLHFLVLLRELLSQLLKLNLYPIVLLVNVVVALFEVGCFLLCKVKTSLLGVRQFFKFSHQRVKSLPGGESVQVFLRSDRSFHGFELLLFLFARCIADRAANDLRLN